MDPVKLTDRDYLRQVAIEFDGATFVLRTWETSKFAPTGQILLGYTFEDSSGVLFQGADFGCSPMNAIDSDAALLCLLSFLTLRPGDTDADYFADYTARQREWCATSACEYLSCEVAIAEDMRGTDQEGADRMPWRDLDAE